MSYFFVMLPFFFYFLEQRSVNAYGYRKAYCIKEDKVKAKNEPGQLRNHIFQSMSKDDQAEKCCDVRHFAGSKGVIFESSSFLSENIEVKYLKIRLFVANDPISKIALVCYDKPMIVLTGDNIIYAGPSRTPQKERLPKRLKLEDGAGPSMLESQSTSIQNVLESSPLQTRTLPLFEGAETASPLRPTPLNASHETSDEVMSSLSTSEETDSAGPSSIGLATEDERPTVAPPLDVGFPGESSAFQDDGQSRTPQHTSSEALSGFPGATLPGAPIPVPDSVRPISGDIMFHNTHTPMQDTTLPRAFAPFENFFSNAPSPPGECYACVSSPPEYMGLTRTSSPSGGVSLSSASPPSQDRVPNRSLTSEHTRLLDALTRSEDIVRPRVPSPFKDRIPSSAPSPSEDAKHPTAALPTEDTIHSTVRSQSNVAPSSEDTGPFSSPPPSGDVGPSGIASSTQN